jgi:acyl-CoA thioesterase FadM
MTDDRPRWWQEVETPPIEGGSHINYVQIAGVLFDTWQQYLETVAGEESHNPKGFPTVRAVSLRVDREVMPDDDLRCGVRAIARSGRSFTLEQVLERRGDATVLAVGTVVLVTVDRTAGAPAAVPEALVAALERAEGHPLGPAAARS